MRRVILRRLIAGKGVSDLHSILHRKRVKRRMVEVSERIFIAVNCQSMWAWSILWDVLGNK